MAFMRVTFRNDPRQPRALGFNETRRRIGFVSSLLQTEMFSNTKTLRELRARRALRARCVDARRCGIFPCSARKVCFRRGKI